MEDRRRVLDVRRHAERCAGRDRVGVVLDGFVFGDAREALGDAEAESESFFDYSGEIGKLFELGPGRFFWVAEARFPQFCYQSSSNFRGVENMKACDSQGGFGRVDRGTYNSCSFLLKPGDSLLLWREIRADDIGEHRPVLFCWIFLVIRLFDLDDLFLDLLRGALEIVVPDIYIIKSHTLWKLKTGFIPGFKKPTSQSGDDCSSLRNHGKWPAIWIPSASSLRDLVKGATKPG